MWVITISYVDGEIYTGRRQPIPPAGRRLWSFKLLADKLVELRFVDGVSYETVRRVLKKTGSSPG